MSSLRYRAWNDAAADMVIDGFEPDPEEVHWSDFADCQYTDPEAFYPEKGGSTREAKKVCRGCPVRTECLEYALDNDEKFGIWGGMSERERRLLKRRQSSATQTSSATAA